MIQQLRNIAIIAHVDHGKTTLVDRLLQQTGTLGERAQISERMMDSGELEKERGITIRSKNTAITYKNYRINIVDTPGHADFGGEVERILSMVDSVLLLVDAVEGPMPQTRFVTQKAFAKGLRPILVVNKIDRVGGDPHKVIDEVFELFDRLEATEEQLDFPIVYASAIQGVAGRELDQLAEDMGPLLDTIIDSVPPPDVNLEGPFQMQVSALEYSSYVGVIGIGRIKRGRLNVNTPITLVHRDGKLVPARILEIMGFHGLETIKTQQAQAGDIVCVTGVNGVQISDTLCDVDYPEMLPPLTVDEPTLVMTFRANTSPFSGRDGKFLTSRQVLDRLLLETTHNVSLSVEQTDDPDQFRVAGRGELQLSVLIETMRREGYELAVSRPEVIYKTIDGKLCEPFEQLVADIEATYQGAIMEELGNRKGELINMVPDGKGRVRLEYRIPSRALMGFRPDFLSLTSGTGILSHNFSHYAPAVAGNPGHRKNGVLVSMEQGKAIGFALFNLQARGRMLVAPQDEIYEGMVVGIHSRTNDLNVNPIKEKKLTNIRASGSDENIILTPAVRFSLEQALEFIEDDELVEVTPNHLRIRKKLLKEIDRKRASRISA